LIWYFWRWTWQHGKDRKLCTNVNAVTLTVASVSGHVRNLRIG
jgi:hypothetical protein